MWALETDPAAERLAKYAGIEREGWRAFLTAVVTYRRGGWTGTLAGEPSPVVVRGFVEHHVTSGEPFRLNPTPLDFVSQVAWRDAVVHGKGYEGAPVLTGGVHPFMYWLGTLPPDAAGIAWRMFGALVLMEHPTMVDEWDPSDREAPRLFQCLTMLGMFDVVRELFLSHPMRSTIVMTMGMSLWTGGLNPLMPTNRWARESQGPQRFSAYQWDLFHGDPDRPRTAADAIRSTRGAYGLRAVGFADTATESPPWGGGCPILLNIAAGLTLWCGVNGAALGSFSALSLWDTYPARLMGIDKTVGVLGFKSRDPAPAGVSRAVRLLDVTHAQGEPTWSCPHMKVPMSHLLEQWFLNLPHYTTKWDHRGQAVWVWNGPKSSPSC